MKYRHELKQLISPADAMLLSKRLDAVMQRDRHSANGSYIITSLYFDDPADRALREKLSGVNNREKFRLRIYDHAADTVWVEKKSKINGLCLKSRCTISEQEARRILELGADYTPGQDSPLLRELSIKLRTQALMPRTIVEYSREAFTFPAGNVRVTLDSDLRTALYCTELFNPGRIMVPASESAVVLEVKWDEFLPDIIRGIVQPGSARTESFSKYAACRSGPTQQILF